MRSFSLSKIQLAVGMISRMNNENSRINDYTNKIIWRLETLNNMNIRVSQTQIFTYQ